MAHTTVSRTIAASPDEVWQLLSDIQNATLWNRSWKSIELLGTQAHGIGMQFRANTEDGHTFDFEVCDWSTRERLAFCPIRDPLEPQYSIMLDSHVFELRPGEDDNETVVDLTANATSHGLRGIIVAMFFWRGHQREGLSAALESVAAVFEETSGDPEQASSLPALEE